MDLYTTDCYYRSERYVTVSPWLANVSFVWENHPWMVDCAVSCYHKTPKQRSREYVGSSPYIVLSKFVGETAQGDSESLYL